MDKARLLDRLWDIFIDIHTAYAHVVHSLDCNDDKIEIALQLLRNAMRKIEEVEEAVLKEEKSKK